MKTGRSAPPYPPKGGPMDEAVPEAAFLRRKTFAVRYCEARQIAPDHDFVRAAGRLRRMRDFPEQAWEYGHHPKNCGFLRRVPGVRVSVGLLRELMRDTLPALPRAITPAPAAAVIREGSGEARRRGDGHAHGAGGG